VLCSALLVAVPLVAAQNKLSAGHSKQLARGEYLVENLGTCGDCHSPRNEKGEFIPSRHFQGAVLDFQPMHPVPGWVPAAPPIAGLVGWTSAEAVKFFMTGIGKSGKPAGPPMPQYRMSRRDAEAVAAYLKSLVPEQN
jgi:mono/diheme cytochrome c family protein